MFQHWKASRVQVEREIKALPSSEKKWQKKKSKLPKKVDHVIIIKANYLKT